MGEINNHADPVHLMDETTPKGTDAAPERLGLAQGVLQERGIGKLVVTVVSEGGVAGAEFIELAEVGSGVANLMQALDAEGRNEFALLESLEGVGAVNLLREVVWVELLQPRHDVYLVQSELNAWFDTISARRDRQEMIKLTRGIVPIGEVGAILWAGSKKAPKCAAAVAFAETLEIDVTRQFASLKGLGEVVIVDAIPVEKA